MKLRSLRALSVFWLLGVDFSTVWAATVYSDRVLFEAQLGPSLTDRYDNLGYFSGDIDDLPEVDIHSNASMSAVLGETQYFTTGNPDTNIIGNQTTNPDYCAGCNGSFLLTFTFTSVGDSAGVFGVGFDFTNLDDGFGGYHAFVTFGDGSATDYALPIASGPPTQFWGITSVLSVSSIHLGGANGQATNGGAFVMDNLTIGAIGASVIPIPSALYLFGSGMLGLVGIARRRAA